MNLLSVFKNSDRPLSPLNDPFKKDAVVAVRFHIYTGLGGFSKSMSASVEFQNGNTKGQQDFRGDDFGVLVRQVEDFITTL